MKFKRFLILLFVRKIVKIVNSNIKQNVCESALQWMYCLTAKSDSAVARVMQTPVTLAYLAVAAAVFYCLIDINLLPIECNKRDANIGRS